MFMSSRHVFSVGLLSVLLVVLLQRASSTLPALLSPQKCRMSWMSPSYILQSDFNESRTNLASRYSLWLYREVGWESNQLHGQPVLFIPGNAGSSHQVRSIASSATRQFYSSPYVRNPDRTLASVVALDFFALEFNEDLSALHGPTLIQQRAYASSAIDYVLSLYPTGTSIIVMGHSMGGIVGTSLLPNPNISAVITMSTPHILPPARFDRRIDEIYTRSADILRDDATPILSLCGGATDMMIPSESCVLPSPAPETNKPSPYRRTVFTTSLEGSWTGVGHLAMVWCHQVRWRVARAALGLSSPRVPQLSPEERGLVLDRWLRDGHTVPALPSLMDNDDTRIGLAETHQVVQNGKLAVRSPSEDETYLFLIPSDHRRFILYLEGGVFVPHHISAHKPYAPNLRVSVFTCTSQSPSPEDCRPFSPETLKLGPTPASLRFSEPNNEGADESDGVVLFVGDLSDKDTDIQFVAVRVQAGSGTSKSWLAGGFVNDQAVIFSNANTLNAVTGTISISLSEQPGDGTASTPLLTTVHIPKLLSNTLINYRLAPVLSSPSCSWSHMPPLLYHPSSSSESHYYPLSPSPEMAPIILHTHASAPYIATFSSTDALTTAAPGLTLTVYQVDVDDRCAVEKLEITIDWWSTLGRWATRYWTAAVSWSVGIVGLLLFHAWGATESGAMPPVTETLHVFIKRTLPPLAVFSFLVSFLPLPARYYLGNQGEPTFAIIAPILTVLATGLVCLSWGFLWTITWPFRTLARLLGRRTEDTGVHRKTVFSMCFLFLLIFLLIPWQVAFFGAWLFHFWTCATASPESGASSPDARLSPGSDRARSPSRSIPRHDRNDLNNCNAHLLLLMTWLLPLAAPVLAVWVRTLATAGLTTPFDGDHNFLYVAPWLILVDFTSWTRDSALCERQRFEPISSRWLFLFLAFVAFFPGPRATYLIFDMACVSIALVVMTRIGTRYWGGYK